jgi:hypothetical protein
MMPSKNPICCSEDDDDETTIVGLVWKGTKAFAIGTMATTVSNRETIIFIMMEYMQQSATRRQGLFLFISSIVNQNNDG